MYHRLMAIAVSLWYLVPYVTINQKEYLNNIVPHISSHSQECVIPVQLVILAVFVYKII